MFPWIEWVVARNMPLSEVDDPLTRSMSKLKPVCSKTLKVYLAMVAETVEATISAEMSDPVGIRFDASTFFLEKYVALFAMHWHDGQLKQTLLSIAPMEEGDLTAQSHCLFIQRIIELFHQSEANLAFLIGDNCATNRAIATRLNVPLIGCASHRFNLAVNSFLDNHKPEVNAVNTLMAALLTINNRSARAHAVIVAEAECDAVGLHLRDGGPLRLDRDDIKQVETVSDLIPKASMHWRIEALLADLRILQSVSVKLQSEDLTLADVRTLFDSVGQRFPSLKVKLSATASIVHSPTFEAAVVINGEVARLTTSDRKAVKRFEVSTATTNAGSKRKQRNDEEEKLEEDFTSSVLRAKKVGGAKPASSAYVKLLEKLPPTSNSCERLFSQAKLVLTPQRATMLPVNF
ncbi:hypothetical protein PC129_g7306 [Phytophthora cactorum]|uniref:Uncharacterized protein n=1 Tax=Phytophthora cactorum TaxID=29920 RepID=A0A8T1BWL6_9STRA|nr:hypothetical protein PC115_g13463 [Phytophthora cactorum]KAG3131122.1 hypothetical protein C6341_g23462 [Phytophthora cactorum]KAG3195872.1 hypothetical protein PC128_g8114 [Phytophthora cactorum]KAG3221963.1 hypothetical protein PC129_g7306 [Phytophthora cactorum]